MRGRGIHAEALPSFNGDAISTADILARATSDGCRRSVRTGHDALRTTCSATLPIVAYATEIQADVIVMGCAGMARHRRPLEAALGVPVIDPTQAAVAMAMGAVQFAAD